MPRLSSRVVACFLSAALLIWPQLTHAEVKAERLAEIQQGATPANAEELLALEKILRITAKKVIPCTVGVQMGGGSGSGVIISEDGYVLTAGHVSARADRDVSIILQDGRRVKGKTLGANHGIDSGLIKIEGDEKWPFCEMGHSKDLAEGQWCVATGHPGGFQPGRKSPYRVGRIVKVADSGIASSCMLVGGDSGGPLFDLNGKVIGINSRIGANAMNIHVPVDTYHATWDRLAKGDVWGGRTGLRNGTPYVGIANAPNSEEAKVGQVVENSPADQAGIQVGDVIVKFDSKPVETFAELVGLVRAKKPGNEVSLVVLRDGEEVSVKLKIGRFGRQSAR